MTNEVKENTPLLNAIGLKKYYPVKRLVCKTTASKSVGWCLFSA